MHSITPISQSSLSIKLTEPHVFVTTPARRGHRNHIEESASPVIIRGLLVLKLAKNARISGIDVSLEGKAITDWPEGIGPRRLEVTEETTFLTIKTSLLNSGGSARRAVSLGPGITYEGNETDGPPSRPVSRPPSREVNNIPFSAGHIRSASALPTDGARLLPFLQEPSTPSPPYSPTTPSIALTHRIPSPPRPRGEPVDVSPLEAPRNQLRHDLAERNSRTPNVPLNAEEPPNRVVTAPLNDHPTPLHGSGKQDTPTSLDPSSSHPLPVHSEPQSSSASLLSSGSSASHHRRAPHRDSFDSDDDMDYFHARDIDDHPIASIPEDRPATNVSSAANTQPSSATSSHPELAESMLSAVEVPQGSHPPPPAGERPPTFQQPSPSLVGRSPGLSTERPSTLSPSPSRTHLQSPEHAVPGSHRPSGSPVRTEGRRSRSRGRNSSRFGFSTVSNIIREVSQEVMDAVDNVRRSSARSQSRVASHRVVPVGSLSRQPSRDEAERPRPSRSYGRGGAGSVNPDRPARTRERDTEPSDGHITRGRDSTINPLGGAPGRARSSSPASNFEGWVDLKKGQKINTFNLKGTYTYPISFAIPYDSPPSLSCDFGSISYKIKATVHRVGTFTTKLSASTYVSVVSTLGDAEESDNLIVERQWEEELRYLVNVDGAAFPIGGVIPLRLTLMPMGKVSLYRVTVSLDEKIDYFAHGRTVVRHDPTRRFELVAIQQTDKYQKLLPIFSESSTAGASSPLAPYARPEEDVIPPTASTVTLEHTSDVVSHLLSPSGPWRLGFDLRLPDCSAPIHFTYKPRAAKVAVSHILKIVMRVSRGDDSGSQDAKGRPKMFDIIVETPIHILSCHCKAEYTHLPTYSLAPTTEPYVPAPRTGCQHPKHGTAGHNPRRPHPPLAPPLGPMAPAWASATVPQDPSRGRVHDLSGPALVVPMPLGSRSGTTSSTTPSASGPSANVNRGVSPLASRTEQFERLVAGQESEAGEIPPAYSADG